LAQLDRSKIFVTQTHLGEWVAVNFAWTGGSAACGWPGNNLPPCQRMERLVLLAARLKPRQLTTSKRAPKPQVPKGFVEGSLARSHVATARVIKAGRATP